MATKIKICPECDKPFQRPTNRGVKQIFCCEAHKQAHANRMAVRGKQLAKIALGWRLSRGAGDLGKFLFAEMTTMLDDWNSEDKLAGRMRADDYAGIISDFDAANPMWSTRYFDRGLSAKQRAARKMAKEEAANAPLEPTPMEQFIEEAASA